MPCMLLLSAVDSCRIKFAFLYVSLFILSLKLKLSSGVATVFFVGRSSWQAEVCCGYSWPSQDQRCPVSGRSRKQRATWCKPRKKGKKKKKWQHRLWHAYPLTAREASMCVCFPVRRIHPWLPSKSWFVWVTSANLCRHSEKTSDEAVSF